MSGLTAKNVNKRFGGVFAVREATFEIAQGGITAIVGPNGAGKSTLLNLITGFLLPDSGSISYRGTSLIGKAPHAVARLGIRRTFQDLRLARGMSVRDNLLLAGTDSSRIATVLSKVGLDVSEGHIAEDLSYGQQKLLTLACCLSPAGDHLFLDEPVAGIHPSLIEQIVQVLANLRTEGRTLVIIEHDLAFVSKVSDQVLVMANGAFIAKGKAQEVLAQDNVVEAYLK